MKSKLFYSLIATFTLIPAAAQGQSAAAHTTAQAQSEAHSGTPSARIDAAMQTAASANIPVSLLQSKVAEGQAKHVPQERIAAAVDARLEALLRASETMKRADVEAASNGELAVTADAIEAGVSQNALIEIARTAPPERRAVALATLSALVQLGHASEQALARVSTVLGSNASLANLHAEVASQLQAAGAVNSTLNGVVRVR